VIFCQAPDPNRANAAQSGICNAIRALRLSVMLPIGSKPCRGTHTHASHSTVQLPALHGPCV